MTELFFKKNNEWQKVYFSDQSFKLNRENPYFTSSESYTLTVTLPMDLLQNRYVLQSINRIDTSKEVVTFPCVLRVDSKPVLSGTAKVVQMNATEVKVQLLGGNSDTNLKGSQLYIDEIDMGEDVVSAIQPSGYNNYNDYGVRFVKLMGYDETAEEIVNLKVASLVGSQSGTVRTPLTSYMAGDAPQPALLDVVSRVIVAMGYTPGEMAPWKTPYKDIYIASVKRTKKLSHTLPHWTAKVFLEEVCKLFNCTMKVDSVSNVISLVANTTFYGSADVEEIQPTEEYQAEVSDDESRHSLSTDNLSFAMSDSASHDWDVLSEAVRDNAPVLTYDSVSALNAAWSAMDANARRKYIFRCPQGSYVDWRDEEGSVTLKSVDMFGPLIRSSEENAAATEMKIVPVAISEEHKGQYTETISDVVNVYDIFIRSLTMANPTGHELLTDDAGLMADVQDLITGEEEIAAKAEKEDLMQVFFLSNQPAWAEVPEEDPDYAKWSTKMPMTDWRYKVYGVDFNRWSLSVKPCNNTSYLGQEHETAFSFNMQARLMFKFIANSMPDPRNIFLIRGKRYGCEKIEASVDDAGFQKQMTGYFYEKL